MPAREPSTIRRRVRVRGRVQGVFFRETIRREAAARSVAGWVENRPDGSVEAVFEGAPDGVDRLVDVSLQGPRGAVVEDGEVFEEEPAGASGFEVR